MSDTHTDKLFIESKGDAPTNQCAFQAGLGTQNEPDIYGFIVPQIHTFQTKNSAEILKDVYHFFTRARGALIELRAVAVDSYGAAVYACVTRALFRKIGTGTRCFLVGTPTQEVHASTDLPCVVSFRTPGGLPVQASIRGVAGKMINWTLVSQVVIAS
jgi:hypothetical protein